MLIEVSYTGYRVMIKPYYFLLGGHDLEMVTIRELLEQHRIEYIDRNLSWGASWSNYQDVIDNFDWEQKQLVGVELGGAMPPRARLIDHHNELAHLPASIEQIAILLGVELTRHQQLIAANDKGYIPAMLALGATEAEVQQIRRLDRQAQGVTEEMEQQAEKDIRLIKTRNKVSIIHTSLPKFSPIVDRLPNTRLLVFNASELTYYGEGAAKLGKLFADEVKAGRMYYGGGPKGFFGVGAGHYSAEAIKQFVNTIYTYFEEDERGY